MFSNIKFYQKKCKRIYLWFHNNYESFLTLIKDCPHPNDICLNSNYYCFNKQSFIKLLSKRDMSVNVVENIIKYVKVVIVLRINKQACDELKKLNDYSISKC